MCVCSLPLHFLKLKVFLDENHSLCAVPVATEHSGLTFRKKEEKGIWQDEPRFTYFSILGPYLS